VHGTSKPPHGAKGRVLPLDEYDETVIMSHWINRKKAPRVGAGGEFVPPVREVGSTG